MEEQKRKNLANCKPSEFMAQCGRVARSVEKWLTATDIMNIRKNVPPAEPIPIDATKEQIEAIAERNRKNINEAIKKNFAKMLDVIMNEHPQETLELLALLCFVEPEDVDNYSVSFYLANLAELLNDRDVISFFTSLAQLAQINS